MAKWDEHQAKIKSAAAAATSDGEDEGSVSEPEYWYGEQSFFQIDLPEGSTPGVNIEDLDDPANYEQGEGEQW